MELILEKLFESQPKVRLMRLFLRNPNTNFTIEDVLRGTGLKRAAALSEISKLVKLGFLKSKNTDLVISRVSGNGKTKKLRMRSVRTRIYHADPAFEFFRELRDLILRQVPESRHRIIQRLRKIGKIKLAIATGAFINSDDARVDLLVVGEKIKRAKLESLLHQWEANTGRELTYALMTTEEFKYRIDMFDRFVRDILESPHDKLINVLNIP
jgi:hypothetical protein